MIRPAQIQKPAKCRPAHKNDWCERGDSNPHGLPRQILSLVRLPIPPLSPGVSDLEAISHTQNCKQNPVAIGQKQTGANPRPYAARQLLLDGVQTLVDEHAGQNQQQHAGAGAKYAHQRSQPVYLHQQLGLFLLHV